MKIIAEQLTDSRYNILAHFFCICLLFSAPHSIQQLVKQLLQRHPNDRPPVSLAATVCQIVLWVPELYKPHESEDNLSELVRR